VGRRITNDITVSDISVSRNQASIKLYNSQHVYVNDLDSKFGTFVKINGLYPINCKVDDVVPI
jgi:pSer/pThr/pTyr-binding forkhead associated (FHA) protein